MARDYQIGAYYFPDYHSDPRNEKLYGKGWTEWDLVRLARPRFPGHRLPRVPLWGYEDESDPAVFARKIEAAASHGLDFFLWDWYWYNDGPFLNRCLEAGYFNAPNRDRLKFALMWANHDWIDAHPLKRSQLQKPVVLYPGRVTEQTFETMTDYIIETYFSKPFYWTIDGCPYFSIYELYMLVDGLGGIPATRRALDRFRHKTRAAGFPDLHLNAVIWGVQILPGETSVNNPREMLAALGFDSVTSYIAIHHIPMPDFPQTSYREVMTKMAVFWETALAEYGLPYYPNVTMGWDASPRTVQSDVFENLGYGFMPLLDGNTPEAFKDSLIAVKAFLDRQPRSPKIFNINAWNEWTESSYLEPDTEYGMGYLEAIRDVFGVG